MSDIIGTILQEEGGFINNPLDSGGPTNWGITQQTLSDWLGHAATIDDVKNLTKDQAVEIYTTKYATPFDLYKDLPWFGLAVDSAVQHGVPTIVAWLYKLSQKYGQLIDADPKTIYRELLCLRYSKYASIVYAKPTQTTFINGWTNRVNAFTMECP